MIGSFSAAAIRISSSRMPVRYSSILRRSAGPSSVISRCASLAGLVENALAVQRAAGADVGGQAGVDRAEQPLEHRSRIHLHRRAACPRFFHDKRVGVRAARAGVAVAHHAGILAADLQRGDARFRSPSAARRAGRRSRPRARPGRRCTSAARRKGSCRSPWHGRRPCAFSAAWLARPESTVMSWRKGSSGFRMRVKAKSAPAGRGLPVLHDDAVRHVHHRQRGAAGFGGARQRRKHGVQQREGDGGAHAAAAACGGLMCLPVRKVHFDRSPYSGQRPGRLRGRSSSGTAGCSRSPRPVAKTCNPAQAAWRRWRSRAGRS